jgi:hypothetical protein
MILIIMLNVVAVLVCAIVLANCPKYSFWWWTFIASGTLNAAVVLNYAVNGLP